MSKIRVLHVAPKMESGGGIENTIMNYYRTIDRSLIQFDFLVHSSEVTEFDKEIRILGGEIYRVTHYHDSIAKNIIETRRIIKEHGAAGGIVHIHTSSGVKIFDGIVAKLLGKKVIFHSHSWFPRKKFRYVVITPAFRFIGDAFLACSSEAGEFFFGRDIITADSFMVLNNAIDLEKYKFNPTIRNEVRRRLGVEANELLVGHVGRFSAEKNHRFVLSVFMELLEYCNNAKLVLVGEGVLKSEIEELSRTMELENRIIFTGVRSDVNELLQAMDVFVFPSEYEGLGMALIEAQASGLPCVASSAVLSATNLTGNVQFLDLGSSAGEWAMKIHGMIQNFSREDQTAKIDAGGYNIEREVKLLQEFYVRLMNPEKLDNGCTI